MKGEPSVCALTLNWSRSEGTVECPDTLAPQTCRNLCLLGADTVRHLLEVLGD